MTGVTGPRSSPQWASHRLLSRGSGGCVEDDGALVVVGSDPRWYVSRVTVAMRQECSRSC
jgi:hypothetical protein